MIRVRLLGPAMSSTVAMLVDSGADQAIIGRQLASRLGLVTEDAGSGRGLSARIPVWQSQMVVEVLHPSGRLPPIEVPVDVLRGREPPLPVLGRDGFFQAFDVLFRVGPEPERGMFLLTPNDSSGDRRVKKHAATRSGPRTRRLAG